MTLDGVSIREDTPGAIREIVALSRERARSWKWSSVQERVARLKPLAKIITRRMNEIVAVMYEETGRVEPEIVGDEIGIALRVAGEWASRAEEYLAERPSRNFSERLVFPFRDMQVRRVPKGIGMAAIWTPWNAPFQIAIGDAVHALMCGHAVIMKASEMLPRTNECVERVVREAGLSDVWRFVHGGSDAGENLLYSLPETSHVLFTGSTAVGRGIIQPICGARNLYFHGELGGMNFMVVLLDERSSERFVARAAKAAVVGRFRNAGQNCNAVKRLVIVDETGERAFPFARRVREEALRLRPGVDYGKIFIPRQMQLLKDQLQDAVSRGAEVLTGNYDDAMSARHYFPPVVLWDARGASQNPLRGLAFSRVCSEEVFGPILPILRVGSPEEALHDIRCSQYRLDAYIFSEDSDRARAFGSQLDVGGCCANDVLVNYAVVGVPFGGVGEWSGWGRRHGRAAVEQLTYAQTEVVAKPVFGRYLGDENHWAPFDGRASFLGIPLPVRKARLLKFFVSWFFGSR